MKTQLFILLISSMAFAAMLLSFYTAEHIQTSTLQFSFLVAIECLCIYVLINIKGRAAEGEIKTNNNNNEVSQ